LRSNVMRLQRNFVLQGEGVGAVKTLLADGSSVFTK